MKIGEFSLRVESQTNHDRGKTSMLNKSPRHLLLFALATQILVLLNIATDLPIIRQVVGFLYLTFLPGLVLLRLLNVRSADFFENLLFSVGLSVVLLMLVGLLLNELSPLIGILRPLSPWPLATVVTAVNLAMLIACFIHAKSEHLRDQKCPRISSYPIIAIYLLLPLLSAVGILFVIRFGDNSISLITFMFVPVLVFMNLLYNKPLRKYYQFALLSIGIALLIQTCYTNYLQGNDIHFEHYILKLTLDDQQWDSDRPTYHARSNSMLSTTVLPTIFSSMLGIDGTWTFKIVYPLIYSIVVLGVYKLAQSQTDERVALLSTFFFMANHITFTQPVSNAKQMIADLFFVLLFIVLLKKDLKPLNRRIFFVLFSFGLITSHYGVSYVFLYIIFVTWAYRFLMKKRASGINLTLLLTFFVLCFSWYTYVSSSVAFEYFLKDVEVVYNSMFTDIFNPQSRGKVVMLATGMTDSPSIWHSLSRYIFFVTEGLVLLGWVTLLVRRREMRLNQEYFVVLTLTLSILILCVALPSFADRLHMVRFYNIALLVLSPLSVFGGRLLFSFLPGLKSKGTYDLLLSAILISLFLFQSGFVYEVVIDNKPDSFVLSGYRMDVGERAALAYECDVFSATWLSKYVHTYTFVVKESRIYADNNLIYRTLSSYSGIPVYKYERLSNRTKLTGDVTYVYLGRSNVVDEVFWSKQGLENTSVLSSIFNDVNRIYSNGGSETYKAFQP